MNIKDKYHNRKVFVTGHTGFKGSWLVRILLLLGAQVRGYSLEPETEPNLYSILNTSKNCDSILADIRDNKHLEKEICDFQPDYVFHLAAQAIVRTSYDIPSETFEVNVIGTANVLDALRKIKNPCTAVLITSDKVYHNNEKGHPYNEEDRLGGYDPYSASKACAELVIDSYRNSFFNRDNYNEHKKAIISARAGNVIGGGDWSKDRLIPDIVRSLSSNLEISIRNPKSVRPWQHVLEPLSGYLLLGSLALQNYLKLSDSYNFGPNVQDTLTVENMVKQAIEIWGNGNYKVLTSNSKPHEADLLYLDITRAENELNWIPRLNAHLALKNTLEWYKIYLLEPENIYNFTEEQIMEYFEL